MTNMPNRSPILPKAITGDRPTGPLHLGHFVGSLKNRLLLQHTHCLTVLVADIQAQTDYGANPKNLQENIFLVMKDYLALGLNPEKVRFVLQSQVPSLLSLTCLLQNFATLSHMERNPTIKTEITQKGFGRAVPLSFLTYPVSQVSDMIGLGGGLIPVGEDQLPIIQLGNDIVGRINKLGLSFPTLVPQLSQTPRLSGICGKQKMSKSLNNAIFLSDTPSIIHQKVMQMYTDETHLRISDKGKIKGNTVFEYLDAFDPEKEEIKQLKEHYQKGGLGDVFLKKRLSSLLQQHLAPIHEKYQNISLEDIQDYLKTGSAQAEETAHIALSQLRTRLFPKIF